MLQTEEGLWGGREILVEKASALFVTVIATCCDSLSSVSAVWDVPGSDML